MYEVEWKLKRKLKTKNGKALGEKCEERRNRRDVIL